MFAIYLENSAWLGTIGYDEFLCTHRCNLALQVYEHKWLKNLQPRKKFAQKSILLASFVTSFNKRTCNRRCQRWNHRCESPLVTLIRPWNLWLGVMHFLSPAMILSHAQYLVFNDQWSFHSEFCFLSLFWCKNTCA